MRVGGEGGGGNYSGACLHASSSTVLWHTGETETLLVTTVTEVSPPFLGVPQIWRSRSSYKSIAVSFCDQLVCSRLLATPAHPPAWLQRRIVSFLSGSSRLLSGYLVVVYIHVIDKACRVAPPQNLVLSQDFRRDFLFTNKLTSRHTGETETPVLTTLRFLGAEDVELVDSIHAQNAPPHRAEMRDESAKSKGKPPNCTTFRGPICTGAADNPFELRKHPRPMAYGAQAKIQNPWRRRRTLPEGV